MGQRGPLKSVIPHPSAEPPKKEKPPAPSVGGITQKALGKELCADAGAVWREIWATNPPVLRSCDATVLGRYCVELAVWRSMWTTLIAEGVSHIRQDRYHGEVRSVMPEVPVAMQMGKNLMAMEKVLGLTPEARLRLPVKEDAPETKDDAVRSAFNSRV